MEDHLIDAHFSVTSDGWDVCARIPGWRAKEADIDGARYVAAWNGECGDGSIRHAIKLPIGGACDPFAILAELVSGD